MTYELSVKDLFDAVSRAGLHDRAMAIRIIAATLGTLGERLTDDERAALADCLAQPLRASLVESRYAGDFDAEELYQRIRHRARVTVGFAREHAQIVLEMIGRTAPEGVIRRLDRALPAEVASMLHPRELGEPPPPAALSGTTLATGRVGSRHPVSESAPRAAHAHSVVSEDNPHGDRKLSSGHPQVAQPIDTAFAGKR